MTVDPIMATIVRSSFQHKVHCKHATSSVVEKIYPRHRKRLKVKTIIKTVLNNPLLKTSLTVDTNKSLTCIKTAKLKLMNQGKSHDLDSNQRRNQSTDRSKCCDVLKPADNRKEDDLLIGQLTSTELNRFENKNECQLPCDTFPVHIFPMLNQRLFQRMSIVLTNILHVLSLQWPTTSSVSSYSPNRLIAKFVRLLSNHHLSSCRSSISTINYQLILLLLPVWIAFVPSDTIKQRHSFSIFAHAVKSKFPFHFFALTSFFPLLKFAFFICVVYLRFAYSHFLQQC